ncbi:ECF transporter S component [Clostridioides difficile]|uniref:ECF transporter S component n=1 Tax=Clostridioides difficile TaxID=1496 RepID=UPI0003B2AC8E|nr:ECF transporter S component [Clostridioides difficile]CCL50720.1 conserved membrane hypothetical protein [Clostridioides difficile T6]
MRTKNIIMSALFIAFGTVLPFLFHIVNLSGKIFLPMHLPVLIAGILLDKKSGLIVGMVTPFISSLITGMPILFPVAFIMTFELSAYGFFIGYFYEKRLNMYISLLFSMILGRVIVVIVVYFLSFISNNLVNLDPIEYIKVVIVTALPGIFVQFIVIPIIANFIKKIIKLTD